MYLLMPKRKRFQHLDNTDYYSEDTNVTTHALMLVGFQSQDESRGTENNDFRTWSQNYEILTK